MVGGGQRGIGVAAPHGRVRDGACATVGAGSNLQTALRGDAMRCAALRCDAMRRRDGRWNSTSRPPMSRACCGYVCASVKRLRCRVRGVCGGMCGG